MARAPAPRTTRGRDVGVALLALIVAAVMAVVFAAGIGALGSEPEVRSTGYHYDRETAPAAAGVAGPQELADELVEQVDPRAKAAGRDVPGHRPDFARGSAHSDDARLAPRMADDFADLASPARRTHILRGDASGGGHLWPGAAGKPPFPRSWSGDRIMHEISDVARDPTAWCGAIPQGSRTVLTGTRGGVDIRVVVDSRTGEIITGYPTNLVRNAQ